MPQYEPSQATVSNRKRTPSDAPLESADAPTTTSCASTSTSESSEKRRKMAARNVLMGGTLPGDELEREIERALKYRASELGPQAAASNAAQRGLLTDTRLVADTGLRLSRIPRNFFPQGASPAEVTRAALDHSYCARRLFRHCREHLGDAEPEALARLSAGHKQLTPEELCVLAELQFAFLCFSLGGVLDAFDHWKQMVHLLCTSEELIVEHVALFRELVSVLRAQTEQLECDLFVDIVERRNFLLQALRRFFSNALDNSALKSLSISSSSNSPDAAHAVRELLESVRSFKSHVTRKYGWDFNELDERRPGLRAEDPNEDEADEEDEFRPVLVQLDERSLATLGNSQPQQATSAIGSQMSNAEPPERALMQLLETNLMWPSESQLLASSVCFF